MDKAKLVSIGVLGAGGALLVYLLARNGQPTSVPVQTAATPTLLGSGGTGGSGTLQPIQFNFPDTQLPVLPGGFQPAPFSFGGNDPLNQTGPDWLGNLKDLFGGKDDGCCCGGGGTSIINNYTSPTVQDEKMAPIIQKIPIILPYVDDAPVEAAAKPQLPSIPALLGMFGSKVKQAADNWGLASTANAAFTQGINAPVSFAAPVQTALGWL